MSYLKFEYIQMEVHCNVLKLTSRCVEYWLIRTKEESREHNEDRK